jgi:nicotinamide riboside transporter PnuC
MFMALAIILSAGFIGWLAWRAVKGMETKIHVVMYVLCALSGVYAIVFFMTMGVPSVAKILVAIAIGFFLIWLAAKQQRRKQQNQP